MVYYTMAEIKKISYKYCIVPMCKSTTIKNPNKLFFHVPNDINKRKKWCKLMRRDLIGPKSTTYVCEDHFDVDNDTENLVKYRLVGGTLKLKANICPHKFDCQKAVKPKKEQEAYEKRRRIEFIENIITKEVPSTLSQSSSFQSFELIECDKMELNEREDLKTEDPLPEDFTESVIHANKKRNKRVQVNIKISQRNKAVQTIIRRNRAKDTGNNCTENVHKSHSLPSRISISSLSSSSNESIISHVA